MEKSGSTKAYESPRSKVIEIKVHSVLCSSPSDNSEGGIDSYEREKFDW